MQDTTRRTPDPDEAREAWAVVETNPTNSNRHRVLLLVVRRSEASELTCALRSRGTNARVVAITDLNRDAMLVETA